MRRYPCTGLLLRRMLASRVEEFGTPAEAARRVLLGFCIGINSADNGVFLRGSEKVAGSGAAHLWGHSSATYYDFVNTQLAGATSRQAAISALHGIRELLGRGVIP